MSRRFPAALKSSFATFGYETDGFIMSMVDIVGVVSDDSAVPEGEACIIGDSPTGLFAGLASGTVAFHRNNPDVWDFMTPWEVRTVFNKELSSIMSWDPSTGRYSWKIISSSGSALPIGIQGQVLFNSRDSSNEYTPDWILKEATVVVTPAELAEKLAETIAPSDIAVIISIQNNNVYRYDFATDAWVLTSESPNVAIGIGRFVWSDYMERLYYNTSGSGLKRLL